MRHQDAGGYRGAAGRLKGVPLPGLTPGRGKSCSKIKIVNSIKRFSVMAERVQIAKSATTVTVACKLPNGLWLQLYDMVDGREMTPQGPQVTKVARKSGAPIKLNGCALRFGQTSEVPMPGGYALTQVPADFWAKWLEANEDSDIVQNRLVFAHDTADKASAQAREQLREKVRSGLEPIDPKNPPRVGMKVTPAEPVV